MPRYVPPPAPPRPTELIPTDREYRGMRLYPFQAQAVDAIAEGHSVLVAAPTGSGKTLVADYAIDVAFEHGWRVVYTSPIKALSNQKYRDFRARHGDDVGILTGDVTMRPDAPLLVMTTEVFRNTLFDEPERLRDFRFVIHDEVHFLDDAERGTVWEESLIHAPPQMRMVCLSATVPNVRELADWIGTIRGEPITVVEMSQRPVPLDHLVWVPDRGPVDLGAGCALLDEPFGRRKKMRRDRTPARLLDWLERERLLPVLTFCFRRTDCEKLALENRRRRLLTPDEETRMAALFDDLSRRYELGDSAAARTMRLCALAGVAWHHAGMLPVYKEVVERLFTSGLLKMLFATETFALGVNMPARAVAFTQLRKFDGERMDYMLCREYGQMAGRAGRQGIDSHGLVISMIDPALDRSAGVRRVLTGSSEPVTSRWNPDYATVLALYEHLGDRVLATYEKSFAKFQRERRRGKSDGKSNEERTIASRLRVLKATGYAGDGKLSAKGEFASRINGYEIHATEWIFGGILQGLPTRLLGTVLLAAAFEPRTDDPPPPCRDPDIRRLRRDAFDTIERWREAEWDAGLAELTKQPDFGLSAPLEAWIDGLPLAKCAEKGGVGEGDLVRWFRLMLQYARQIKKGLPADQLDLARRLAELIRAVDRDEVDAQRQMELGEEGEDEAAETDENGNPVAPPAPAPRDDVDDRAPPQIGGADAVEPRPMIRNFDLPPERPETERREERAARTDRPERAPRPAPPPSPSPSPAPPAKKPPPKPDPLDDFGMGLE